MISSHCSSSEPRRAGREHREVGRGAVGVDVGEAAGHACPRRRARARRAARAPRPTNVVEAVPGDRGLEGLGDHARRDQRVAQVGRLEEGVAPGALGLAALARRGSPAPRRRGRAHSSSARVHPGVDRVVGRLEAEHEQRLPVRRGAGQRAPRPGRAGGSSTGRGRTGRAPAPPRRPASKSSKATPADALKRGRVLHPHPRLGDHAEDALGADQHPVRARAGARARAGGGSPTRRAA